MDDKILEGTTTVGITCKDGVVFASERRASMGNLVAHKVAEQIFKIDDHIVTTIAGSLVGIKAANLDRDFAGIGFIKIGDKYFYSDTYAVKNVSAVASAALADTTAVANDEYKYEISAGVYSPYTKGQREILNTLIKK